MIVALRAIAEKKTFGHRLYCLATRRQSFGLPNMIQTQLRRFWRRLSYLTDFLLSLRLRLNACIHFFKRFSESDGVIAPITKQPFHLGQVAHSARDAM